MAYLRQVNMNDLKGLKRDCFSKIKSERTVNIPVVANNDNISAFSSEAIRILKSVSACRKGCCDFISIGFITRFSPAGVLTISDGEQWVLTTVKGKRRHTKNSNG